MLLQPKQINKFLAALLALTNQNVASASSLNVTGALTTLLATAGNGGSSVPLNSTGSNTSEGLLTGSTAIVNVSAYPQGGTIEVGGNTVYATLTYAASVYTVNFFTNVAGVQTACVVNQAISLQIPYMFSFADLPAGAFLTSGGSSAGGTSAGTQYLDTGIAVTALNTISNLAKQPINPAAVVIFVNGVALFAGVNFSVNGQAITISAAQITATGYSIATTDTVAALYSF